MLPIILYDYDSGGYMTDIISALTALGTIGLLFVTWMYVQCTKKLVDETVALRKMQSDPIVIVDFFGNQSIYKTCCIVFKNIGKSTAYNVKASFVFESATDNQSYLIQNVNESGVVKTGIHYLQPERDYVVKMGISSDYRELYGLKMVVCVSYVDEHGGIFSKRYSINFDYLKGVLSSTI